MTEAPLLAGLAAADLSAAEEKLFRELRPAGFILAARNLRDPGQTRALTDRLRALAGPEAFIALSLDELAAADNPVFPRLPGPAALVARNHARTTGQAGRVAGEMMRMLGVNLHLGPDFRLLHTLRPARESRWSADCQQVIDHAGVWNRWFIQRGPLSCPCGFPGGATGEISALDRLPVCDADLAELLRGGLLPFTALAPEFQVLLTGPVLYPGIDPDRPACLSRRIVTALLRDQLGFDRHPALADGLDEAASALGMSLPEAAGHVFAAGHDLLLIRGDPTATGLREIAAALSAASGPVWYDSAVRLERVRAKLPPPTPWSAEKWSVLEEKAFSLQAS